MGKSLNQKCVEFIIKTISPGSTHFNKTNHNKSHRLVFLRGPAQKSMHDPLE